MSGVSSLPTTDSIFFAALGLVGVPAAIVSLVALAMWAAAWLQAMRQFVAGTRRARSMVGRFLSTIGQMRPVRVAFATLVTILVPVSQALLLGIFYIAGNYISLAFDPQRARRVQFIVDQRRVGTLNPSIAATVLQVNGVSGAFLIICALAIIASYKNAIQGRDVEGIAAALGLPGYGLGLFALVIVLPILALGAFVDHHWIALLGPVAAAAVCFLYVLACQAGIRASVLLLQAWSPRTEPEGYMGYAAGVRLWPWKR